MSCVILNKQKLKIKLNITYYYTLTSFLIAHNFLCVFMVL